MQLIHSFASNFLTSFMALLFYEKITTEKPRQLTLIIIPFLFASYMTATHNQIWAIFRLGGGLIIIAFIVKTIEKRVLWSSIIVSFLFVYFLTTITNLIAVPFIDWLELNIWLTYLLAEITLYLLALWKIKLPNGFLAFEEKGAKNIILAIAITVFTLYSAIHAISGIVVNFDSLIFEVILTFLMALFIAIIILSIKLIIYLTNQGHKFKEAESRHHKYNNIFPVLMETHRNLAKQLDSNNETDIQAVKDYLHLVEKYNSEIADEVFVDSIKEEIDYLKLPIEFYNLSFLLKQKLHLARTKNVSVHLKSEVRNWQTIPLSGVKLDLLFGNLLDNAIKETAKMNDDDRQIIIEFFEKDEIFWINIHDTAAHFPIHILQNLGKRGNSINGTGDGYAEIFEITGEVRASFLIEEWMDFGMPVKTISITFDELGQIAIDSDYRRDKLQKALKDSLLDVL